MNQPQPPPQAPPAATPTPLPAPTPMSAPPQTFFQKLDAGDLHWAWKLSLRAVTIASGLIGIGCMAWAVANPAYGPYVYALDDTWCMPWSLITFGVSVIWCAIVILVLIFRRPNAPVHPGLAVALDLLLWLGFIASALFALMGVYSVRRWGEDGIIGEYSSYGTYYLQSNGTWVWNATEYDTYFQRSRDCSSEGRYSRRYSGYGFDSCEEEDAYVNTLWQTKGHRVGVETTGTVCQFLSLVLHLALFIWACVDTHYRNSKKVSKQAEKLAADIVMNMVRSGAVVQPPGAQMRPPMSPPMMPPQQHMAQPRHFMAPQPFPMTPQPPVGYGQEKSEGPRYA